mmetsp:Transcript_42559/g.103310  ORF Transcript_42559/g.103310 Transcript_42559/m.103310 type:complete len:207 (+) Transcript_42559:878-1498(+)
MEAPAWRRHGEAEKGGRGEGGQVLHLHRLAPVAVSRMGREEHAASQDLPLHVLCGERGPLLGGIRPPREFGEGQSTPRRAVPVLPRRQLAVPVQKLEQHRACQSDLAGHHGGRVVPLGEGLRADAQLQLRGDGAARRALARHVAAQRHLHPRAVVPRVDPRGDAPRQERRPPQGDRQVLHLGRGVRPRLGALLQLRRGAVLQQGAW